MTDRQPTSDANTGHGHVFPRPDGVKARCGGPGICTRCSLEKLKMEKVRDDKAHKAGALTSKNYTVCHICGVEIRIRVDGMIPYHSKGVTAVASKRGIGAQPEDYCPGGNKLPLGAGADNGEVQRG